MLNLELARIINEDRQREIETRLRERGLLAILAERAAECRELAFTATRTGTARQGGSSARVLDRSR
jgi:hypothetical protein